MPLPKLPLLCLLAGIQATAAVAGPVVQIGPGRLEGDSVAGVERFLGIPFAAPPVGALRWRPPQPAAPWLGVRPATRFGADCMQEAMVAPPGPGWINPVSEDCLYLNIWRPAPDGVKPAAKLPVMVWIYGGAFIMGAGSFPTYDGTSFAKRDVVMVNLNYRLGRFGFFAHPALTREAGASPVGNYGIMDQIAALQWVRQNIGAFGGDPDNVTIFGESAGAASVNLLMASPAARGLFHKAIAESGGAGDRLASLAHMEAEGKQWAVAKGVGQDDVAALRALPAATVLDAPVTKPAAPFIDGRIVTQSTDLAFKSGAVAQVPYLAGSNGYEESLLRWIPGAEQGVLKRTGVAGDAVLAQYAVPGVAPVDALKKMWGDASMTVPARARTAAMARTGQAAWLYRYTYVPAALRATVPGAGHEAEIEMVFATRQGRIPHPWSADDERMAAAMNGAWVAFARDGVPAVPGGPAWPRYNGTEKEFLHFGNDGATGGQDPQGGRLDALERALAPAAR